MSIFARERTIYARLLHKRRYAQILYVRSLRNFKKVSKIRYDGLHAYSVGCYSHICLQRFSQGLDIKTWSIQFHAFFANQSNIPSRDYRKTAVVPDTELEKADSCVSFIREFTLLLSSCFSQISNFLEEERRNITYHALWLSADRSIMYPFVIKALLNEMPHEEMEKLAKALEQIFLRNRIIGTRANLVWRLNDCFQKMNNSAKPVVDHIQWMKGRRDWWGFWNDDELSRTLNRGINRDTAKILLWKYETHLIQSGKAVYKPLRFDDIDYPHLEHIAPQTENQESDNGYCQYDEEFYNNYLECLGNYLLLSGSHNISLSNGRFQIKRDSYTQLKQQLEVQVMTEQDKTWDKDKIRQRRDKIVAYLKEIL